MRFIASKRLDGTRFWIYPTTRSLRVFIEDKEVVSTTTFFSKILNLIEPHEEFLFSLSSQVKEPTVYAELYGPNSFVGKHIEEEHKIAFLALGGSKYLIPPDEYIDMFMDLPRPRLLYNGVYSEEYVEKIRGSRDLKSGAVCYGLDRKHLFDIRTRNYFKKLQLTFGKNWIKYWI